MAHAEFFGDAFQYTHRGLLHATAPPNEWIVHPMLFRSVGGGQPGGGLELTHYAQFLGLAREAVLPEVRNGRRLTRQTMVADVEPYAGYYLFLDPDTGIDENGEGSTQHVSAQQMAEIAGARNGRIVLVFDHAYGHAAGRPQDRVAQKLQLLWYQNRLHGVAAIVRTSPLVYYVWVSTMHYAVDDIMGRILQELPIPARLLIPCPCLDSSASCVI